MIYQCGSSILTIVPRWWGTLAVGEDVHMQGGIFELYVLSFFESKTALKSLTKKKLGFI